jgi:PAS domain S-box-containing protein
MVDAIYPEDRERAIQVLPELIANGGGTAEIRLWNEQTGQPFWVNWTVFVINDPKTGKPMALATISPDITERRENQRVLEEKEAALRNTIELAELGTFNVDMVANTITVSPRVANWFGFDSLTADANSFIDRVGEADQDLVRTSLYNTLLPESKGRYDVVHSVVHAKTGHQIIIHALGQLYVDDNGQPLRVEGTAQDITSQRKLQLVLENQVQQRTEELAASNEELASINEELTSSNEEYAVINEELEEANGLLSRSNDNLQTFAYIASHDLQEPLRKIQQFGDLLKTRLPVSVGNDELVYLERMQVAASRMSGLIKDLLSFSRISTQRSIEKPVSLQEIVGDVLDLLELTVIDSKAQIQVDNLPTVSGDAVQLNQLFQNLISNALKFQRIEPNGTPIPPEIRISAQLLMADALPPTIKPARRASGYHRIEVADNGIGFDEKYLTRIFQVFQRLHGKSQYAGTGIGLAICEKVVTNHGGVITASSQPGQGATFIIYLPAD